MSRVTDFEYVKNAHHSYRCVSVAVTKCNDIRVEDQSVSVIESGLRIFITSSLPARDGVSLWRSITCCHVADNISDGPNYWYANNRAPTALIPITIKTERSVYLQELSSEQW